MVLQFRQPRLTLELENDRRSEFDESRSSVNHEGFLTIASKRILVFLQYYHCYY